jgi:hypothetical protein
VKYNYTRTATEGSRGADRRSGSGDVTTRHRAPTTRLEPGEHSVDRAIPAERTFNGQKVIALDWSVRLYDGQVVRRRTKGPTETVVRRRAKAKAEAVLASTEPGSIRVHRLAQEIAALSHRQRERLFDMVGDLQQ